MTTCCGPITKLLALGAVVTVVVSVGLMFRGDSREAVAEETSRTPATEQSGADDATTGSDEPAVVTTSSGGQSESGNVQPADGSDDSSSAKSTEDARMAREVVGKWKTIRAAGPRELEMRDDGTATMDVKIEAFALKLLFGKQMRLDIKWHIADGLLHMETVGGEPKSKVELLKSTYGATLAYPILELTKNRLLVKDGEDDPDHDWERVED